MSGLLSAQGLLWASALADWLGLMKEKSAVARTGGLEITKIVYCVVSFLQELYNMSSGGRGTAQAKPRV